MAKARPSDPAVSHARESQRLSTLLEISQALSGTLNLKSALHRVLEILAKHHGTVRSLVTLLRENGELHGEAAGAPEGGAELHLRTDPAQPARRRGAGRRSQVQPRSRLRPLRQIPRH